MTNEGWISVKDRRPKCHKCVIVAHDGVSDPAFLDNDGTFRLIGWHDEVLDVTHWMPLPTPPTEASRNA